MDKIIKLALPEDCRIIAVSDIHTHWQLLDSLLKKRDMTRRAIILLSLAIYWNTAAII